MAGYSSPVTDGGNVQEQWHMGEPQSDELGKPKTPDMSIIDDRTKEAGVFTAMRNRTNPSTANINGIHLRIPLWSSNVIFIWSDSQSTCLLVSLDIR